MKKIDLGQMIQTLANLGVIAGIVFLGFEIRQNTAQLMRGEMNATHEQFQLWRQSMMTDGDLAQIWLQGLGDASSLTQAEQLRFYLTLGDWFWTDWQYWDRARIGVIPKEWESRATGDAANRIRNSESVRAWWEENKKNFGSEFYMAIDIQI